MGYMLFIHVRDRLEEISGDNYIEYVLAYT